MKLLKKTLKGEFFPRNIVINSKDLITVQLLLRENNISYSTINSGDLFVAEKTIEEFNDLANYEELDDKKLDSLVERIVNITEDGYFNEYGEYPDFEDANEEFTYEKFKQIIDEFSKELCDENYEMTYSEDSLSITINGTGIICGINMLKIDKLI